MKIRHLVSALSIASLGFTGVSCKSTKTAKGGGDDGAYVGYDTSGNGEYDNVYEMGGSDDDTYSYTSPDSSSGSSYNYESNDYSSGSGSSNSNYVPVPAQPAYTPPPAQPSYSAPAPASTGSSHTVERGDTLFNLSRRYGTSVAAIQNANGLSGDLIKIGQTLVIP
ncbi:MAG: LysM peptidoglycan-binding domain-containing protein [Verrucomicrobiales bacterium]